MEDNKLTQEMNRHAVIVVIHAKHSHLEISQFFNVARSIVHKVCRELEASDGNEGSVTKHRKHKPRLDTLRAPQFVQHVKNIIKLRKTLQSP